MKARILLPGGLRPRVAEFFARLVLAASEAKIRVEQYRGETGELLIAYGCGDPAVADTVNEHIAAGGQAVCWDVGYWGKSFRMALNGHHPKALPEGDGSRWEATGIALREDYDPAGPIVLVGVGPKSRYMDGDWEHRMLSRIRAVYPDRPVLFRPKPNRSHATLDCVTDGQSKIEDVLRGASLVVCRHSNVGVDACIAGVPVVCESGTPALLYGSDLAHPRVPSAAERLEFLQRVAWLNWWESEAPQIWRWMRRLATTSRSDIG